MRVEAPAIIAWGSTGAFTHLCEHAAREELRKRLPGARNYRIVRWCARPSVGRTRTDFPLRVASTHADVPFWRGTAERHCGVRCACYGAPRSARRGYPAST